MKLQWRLLSASCFVALLGFLFLPIQNRTLFFEHWRSLISTTESYNNTRGIYPFPVTSAAPPIIQIDKAFQDSFQQGLNQQERETIGTTNMRNIVNAYPKDPAALAFYLRNEKRLINGLRVGGPLASMYPAWSVNINPDKTSPTPSFKLNGSFSSKKEYEETLALIERGQKLEPQNTYFDWMMMLALLHAGRMDEANQVLEKAWKKTDFNDHTNDEVTARINYERHSGLEPELKQKYLNQTLLPHLSPMREITRYLAQHTMSLHMQKRDKEALEWGKQCVQFARLVRLRGNFLITSEVGAACELLLLKNAALRLQMQNIRLSSDSEKPIPASLLTAYPYSLPHLASNLKQHRVVKKLEAEWNVLQRWRIPQNSYFDGVVSSHIYWPLGWIQRVDQILILSLPVSLGLAFLFSLFSQVKPLPQLKEEKRSLRFALWGGVGGLLLIASQLFHQCWLFLSNVGGCVDPHYPMDVLTPSSLNYLSYFNHTLGLALIPLFLIWLALVTSGTVKWKFGFAISKSASDPLEAFDNYFPSAYFLWHRCIILFLFIGRFIGPVTIFMASLAALFIPLHIPNKLLNAICGAAILSVVLLVIPAVLLAARLFIQRQPHREVFPIIPSFLWRVRALLGGYCIAAMLSLVFLLPLQAGYTEKFNQQFAILERRQTIQTLQSRGLLPPN